MATKTEVIFSFAVVPSIPVPMPFTSVYIFGKCPWMSISTVINICSGLTQYEQ